MFKKILAATDGSDLSLKGVEQACELAARLGAGITVMTVEEPYSYANVTAYRPESFEQYSDRMRQEVHDRIESARKVAETYGVKPEFVTVRHVSPAAAILKQAASDGTDLIVMASRGRSGISAVLLGSVTRQVLAEAQIPVLVCR